MAKIYVGDIEADAPKLVGWICDYEQRTGNRVDCGRDARGYFIEVPSDDEAVFAILRFA